MRPAPAPRELVRYELATGRITRAALEDRSGQERNDSPARTSPASSGSTPAPVPPPRVNDGVKVRYIPVGLDRNAETEAGGRTA